MLATILRLLFVCFGFSMACVFAGFGMFFLAWVMSRASNGWER